MAGEINTVATMTLTTSVAAYDKKEHVNEGALIISHTSGVSSWHTSTEKNVKRRWVQRVLKITAGWSELTDMSVIQSIKRSECQTHLNR